MSIETAINTLVNDVFSSELARRPSKIYDLGEDQSSYKPEYTPGVTAGGLSTVQAAICQYLREHIGAAGKYAHRCLTLAYDAYDYAFPSSHVTRGYGNARGVVKAGMATSLGTYPNCTWSNLRIGHAVLIATKNGDGHTTCITGLKNGCDGSQASHWLVTSNWGDKICQMSLDTQIKYYTDKQGGLYNGQVYYTTFGKNIGAGATSDVRITLSCAKQTRGWMYFVNQNEATNAFWSQKPNPTTVPNLRVNLQASPNVTVHYADFPDTCALVYQKNGQQMLGFRHKHTYKTREQVSVLGVSDAVNTVKVQWIDAGGHMTTDEFTQTGDRAYFSLYQEVYLEALGWRPYCWFEFKSSSLITRTTPVVSAGQMHMFYTGRLPAGEQFLASNPFSEGSCAKNVDYIAWWFIQNGVQDLRAVAGIVGTICGELGGVVDFCGCEKWESGLTPSWPQPLRNFPVKTQRTSTSTGQRAYGIGSTTSPNLVNALKAKFTATQLQHDYYNSNTIVYSTEDPIIEDYARYECEAILEAMKAGGKESGFTFDQFAKGQTGFSVEKCVAFVMAQYEMPGWSMSSAQSYRGYPSRRDYGRAVYQRIQAADWGTWVWDDSNYEDYMRRCQNEQNNKKNKWIYYLPNVN